MEAKTPQLAVDPNLEAEKQQAQQNLITGLRNEAQIDTASIMARFGTSLALSGSGMAPAAAPVSPMLSFGTKAGM